MTRPVFRVDPDVIRAATGERAVTGAEARHAVTVARVVAGELIDLVDGVGGRARAVVRAAAKPDRLVVDVIEVHHEPPPTPRLVIAQALIKGDRAERAIETMTEVGVDVIVPWQAARCVVRWDGKAERARDRWQTAADEAAKQSRRAWVPEVTAPTTTADLIGLVGAATVALFLDDTASVGVMDVPPPPDGDVLIIVGPEGGVTEEERAAIVAAGAGAAHLGPTILRAATAGTVAAALLLARTNRWDLAGSRHE